MTRYGHPLEFGTFITPTNDPAGEAVDLALLSEALGYELVTFQDHPYQPAFLDTWTLLTWVAARTERIRISANVINLPLRPPAVLARAAASLDLLSHGRFELGLGAGAFWDAIEAMGGQRLTPGQAVDALSEAIDVIRGIWDVDERAMLRVEGDHYRVKGARRGPAPAHDIPIWLGAYKPRMLRLVGRKADGWIPSLGYLKPGDLPAGNARIDEAAIEAGRDPREIRRLLNISGRFLSRRAGPLAGPSEQWVQELLPLAMEDGIGTFILSSDDPGTMERFASEVAPALREAVAREHSDRGTTPGTIRSTAVRARRRDGIRYDDVPAALAENAIEPGDARYSRARSTYLRGGSPGLVLRPRTTPEVVDAVAFARSHPGVPLSVRSGGHGISGRSTNDGGIVIDLREMASIDILDEATRLVRIGPGARWMDVASALAPHGWALSSGDYGGVGVGGLATAGGIGWLAREHGLTIDHLRAVEMVLADGSVVRASEDERADLFWAVRGAGGSFGIVTAFEFQVEVVGDVGWAQLALDATDTAGSLVRWGAAVEAAPRDLTSFLIMGRPQAGQVPIAQVLSVVDSDDPATIVDRLRPLAASGPLLDQSIAIVPYQAVMANAHDGSHKGRGEPISRSVLVDHITPSFAAAAARLMESGAVHFFQIRSVGGAVADVGVEATAYAGRTANFSVVAFGSDRSRLDASWAALEDEADGLYVSFETDFGPDRLERAFPPPTLERLRVLKRRYDPDDLFRDNVVIAPTLVSVA